MLVWIVFLRIFSKNDAIDLFVRWRMIIFAILYENVFKILERVGIYLKKWSRDYRFV